MCLGGVHALLGVELAVVLSSRQPSLENTSWTAGEVAAVANVD